MGKLRCHYEVLALERDAASGDIKKAFHKQALKWHPDKHQKNGISADEATQRFQEIQNAYEVLSDPHERKWYDEHREQILRGDDDGESGENENELNLFKFFSASVYAGFGDDEKSFYSVYGALFEKIDALDIDGAGAGAGAHRAPVLGNSRSDMDEVNHFYRHWTSYITQRSFGWVDEYKTTDAPTRQIRRAMEKENKKLRDVAKKAFTSEVRELVEFVRKRDPRMIAYLKKKEKEREEQLRVEEQKKKDKQAAYEAQREAFQQQEQERWADSAQATSRLAEDQIQEELERLRKKMDADLLLCEICNKTFKSDKQLQNHLTSKKHKEREVELGIVSDFDLVEDELDRELQAELEEMKRAKQQKTRKEDATINVAMEELAVKEEDESTSAEAEAQAQALREKERIRLEKEQKAAEKRKERKDARKTKKKEEVEKIVTAAKKKDIDSDEEDGKRGKGSRGKKKR